MEPFCKIAGWLLILLALLHIIFPTYFKWKKELTSLSLINRQIMYVHTFFIGLVVFGMGLLCVTQTEELITTDLGHQLSLGLSVFWFIRLLFQVFVYSPALWRGKRFETFVHVLFMISWSYLSLVFYFLYRAR